MLDKTTVIAIEGIDGSGKSVQFDRLAQALRASGYTVQTRSYPVYHSFFGRQVGKLLSGVEGVQADKVDGMSMALWFALDRWEDLKAYQDGSADVLLINRYVLSNAVYQSIRDCDLNKPDIVEWVFDLEFRHFGIPEPDVHLFFDVSADAAGINVERKGFRDYVGSGKDIYEASSDIQQRARLKYLECAARFDNVAVIPCMQGGRMMGADKITDEAIKVISNRGLIKKRL